ncbi:TniQ family protein [Cytobacillus oceanisediminis]|uniref:TniQ domain-containing protein n=1 Tax=Cytobacillus oceanisediminis 2691 TaxID=1196031 RepID=A0A160ME91_9BACI|nr:TniQ family protein [Cytobacillus oceanisediminis]AND41449.1 hypothetical protein A361_20540 [Cytobacillus oceanisediminis 2691]
MIIGKTSWIGGIPITSLLNTPIIHEEESLAGFVYRLASANYYSSPKIIADHINLTLWDLQQNVFDKNMCKEISYLSNVDIEDLYERSYHPIEEYMDLKIKKLLFLKSSVKFCPECLKGDKVHKYLWGFNSVSMCIKHSLILSNCCQYCKRKIQLKSLLDGRCSACGFHYENSPVNRIQKQSEYYKAQYELHQFILGDNNCKFSDSELTLVEYMTLFDALFKLFDGLNTFIQPMSEGIYMKFDYHHLYDQTFYTAAFANVYWMCFVNYPHNLIYALESFDKSDCTMKKYRKRQFKKTLSGNKSFLFLKKEYEKYLLESAKAGRLNRNLASYDKETSQKLKIEYYNKRDLIERFNLSKGEVNELCVKGWLKPNIINKGKYINYLFEVTTAKKVISDYQLSQKSLITKKESARLLGISIESINTLIQEGIIEQKASLLNKQTSFIDENSIDKLTKSISKKAKKPERKEPSSLLSLKKCLDKYVTSGLQISKLIKLSIDGKIKVYKEGDGSNLTHLYFEEDEIKRFLKTESIQRDGYNLGEASKILGFGERTLHKMINANIINPDKIMKKSNNRVVYMFSQKCVDDFYNQFITASDASLKYQININTLRNYIFDKKIRNELSGICNRVLFEKKELEALLFTIRQQPKKKNFRLD